MLIFVVSSVTIISFFSSYLFSPQNYPKGFSFGWSIFNIIYYCGVICVTLRFTLSFTLSFLSHQAEEQLLCIVQCSCTCTKRHFFEYWQTLSWSCLTIDDGLKNLQKCRLCTSADIFNPSFIISWSVCPKQCLLLYSPKRIAKSILEALSVVKAKTVDWSVAYSLSMLLIPKAIFTHVCCPEKAQQWGTQPPALTPETNGGSLSQGRNH